MSELFSEEFEPVVQEYIESLKSNEQRLLDQILSDARKILKSRKEFDLNDPLNQAMILGVAEILHARALLDQLKAALGDMVISDYLHEEINQLISKLDQLQSNVLNDVDLKALLKEEGRRGLEQFQWTRSIFLSAILQHYLSRGE
jgi:hypothetical protein